MGEENRACADCVASPLAAVTCEFAVFSECVQGNSGTIVPEPRRREGFDYEIIHNFRFMSMGKAGFAAIRWAWA